MMGNLGDFSPAQDGIRQEAAFVSRASQKQSGWHRLCQQLAASSCSYTPTWASSSMEKR